MTDDATVSVNIVATTDDLQSNMAKATQVAQQSFQSIGSAAKNSSATFDTVTSATRGYSASLMSALTASESAAAGIGAAGAATKAVGEAATEATAAQQGLSLATSGVTREIVVLGREAMSGNLSRMPGSLLVLGSRMGVLNATTLGAVASFGALAAVVFEVVRGLTEAETQIDNVQKAMILVGRGQLFSPGQTDAAIEQLSRSLGIARSAAADVVLEIQRIPVATDQMRTSLTAAAPALAVLTNETAAKAAEQLASAIQGGASSIEKFGEKINLFDAEQVKSINLAKAAGDEDKARSVFIEALNARLGDQIRLMQQRAGLEQQRSQGFVGRGPGTLERTPTLAPGGAAPDESAVRAQELADQYNETLLKREAIEENIRTLETALASSDTPAKELEFQQAITAAKQQAAELDARLAGSQLEQTRTRIAQMRAMNQGGQAEELSAEIQVWNQKIADGTLYGSALLEATRERAAAQAQLNKAASSEELSAAREHISQLQATMAAGSAAELKAEEGVWQQLIAGSQLNAQQRGEARMELNRVTSQLAKQELADEIEAIRQKEAADKGDITLRLADADQLLRLLEKNNAQGTSDYRQALTERAEIQQEFEQQQVASQLRVLTAQQTAAQAAGEAARSEVDFEAQLGAISETQKVASLRDIEQQTFASQERILQQQISLDNLSLAERTKLLDRLVALTQAHNLKLQQLDQQAALAEKQRWEGILSPIESSLQTSIEGIVAGTTTATQAMTSLVTAVANDLIGMALKAAEQWVLSLFIIKGSASAASMAQSLGEIINAAAVAAANTFAAVSATPIVGPALAPAAAAAAEAEVLAFGATVTPFAEGAWSIPTTMLGLLHQGEAVVPETFARGLRNGGGNFGGGTTVINLSAIDGPSVKKFLAEHGGSISGMLRGRARNFDPNLQPR